MLLVLTFKSLIELITFLQMLYYLLLDFLAGLGIETPLLGEDLHLSLDAVEASDLNLSYVVPGWHCDLNVEDYLPLS
jgi:hypothetical protein